LVHLDGECVNSSNVFQHACICSELSGNLVGS
jgi:hypothetical protein